MRYHGCNVSLLYNKKECGVPRNLNWNNLLINLFICLQIYIFWSVTGWDIWCMASGGFIASILQTVGINDGLYSFQEEPAITQGLFPLFSTYTKRTRLLWCHTGDDCQTVTVWCLKMSLTLINVILAVSTHNLVASSLLLFLGSAEW